MPLQNPTKAERRVLVLAPTARDAEATVALLRQAGIDAEICRTMSEICRDVAGAGAAVVTQEAVLAQSDELKNALAAQPAWSDVPIIVLTSKNADELPDLKALEAVGHMTLIRRPVQVNGFLSAISAALRDRLRQYRLRDYLLERDKQALALKTAVEKSEAANIAKSEFLANMSHEIRTPMNAIYGATQLLESDPLNDRQKKVIGILKRSSEALLAIINDLLDISKIEAGKIVLDNQPFQLMKVIDEVVNISSAQARQKGLALVVEGHCASDKHYFGDEMRLRQILLNLVSNAVKFTDSGKVEISAVCGDSGDGFEDVTLSVADTGIGIAPEQQRTIFDKFVQADSTINRKYGGTGLGLSITRRLVELMRGTIQVESAPGKGARFTVRLRLPKASQSDTAENAAAVHAARKPEGTPPHILVVDDYEPNVEITSAFLGAWGYSADSATSAAAAFDKVRANTYDAILMDVQMPKENGLEATGKIRAFERKSGRVRTPIIAMTAHALAGDRERCIQADMDDYIAKPFAAHELKQVLNMHHVG